MHAHAQTCRRRISIVVVAITLALFAVTSAACTSPVVYPRSGDVLEAGQWRIGGSSNMGWTYLAADLGGRTPDADPSSQLAARGRYRDYWVSTGQNQTMPRLLLAGLGAALMSFEIDVSYSPLGLCELGWLASQQRFGAEVRCAVLDEDRGQPFSLAVSGALTPHILLGPTGLESRAGLDFSRRGDGFTFIFDSYIDYGPHRWDISDSRLPIFRPEEWGFDHIDSISVERDQWTVSFPIAIATRSDGRSALTIGIVPEFTIAHHDRNPLVYREDQVISRFDQHWAIYLTLGGQIVTAADPTTVTH